MSIDAMMRAIGFGGCCEADHWTEAPGGYRCAGCGVHVGRAEVDEALAGQLAGDDDGVPEEHHPTDCTCTPDGLCEACRELA